MSIDRISFVGVDNKTDFSELKRLADISLVKLEFGVLYSETKKDKRYPDRLVIDNLSSYVNGQLPYSTSLHLCGTSVDKFVSYDRKFLDGLLHYEMEDGMYNNQFDAVQLNFTLKSDQDIQKLVINALKSCALIGIRDLIFQANKSKTKLVEYIQNMDLQVYYDYNVNIRLLYDGSGGFGRTIEKIDKPFKGFYTGYAGGINPETIHKIAYDVELASGETDVYLDMESGVRENNWFSIEKCEKIIECVNKLKQQSIWNGTE